MTNQARGRYVPDYRRLKSANEPRLREPVPQLQRPIENANAHLVKSIVTLNRAGSHRGNPILKGLGIRTTYKIDPADTFSGLHLFQSREALGNNLIRQAANTGELATYDFVAGSGTTVAGDPGDGAVRNFIRWQSQAGAVEREFWLKNYDADIVTLNGEAVLDPDTFDPVEIVVSIVDADRDWIDIPADFMSGWGDEFHVPHRRTDGDIESGFEKAYGGALVVSFFDEDPGTEGVGVQVNPINQEVISSLRKIQVENAEGLKELVARFRSEADSSAFVDIPILVRVIAPDDEVCESPVAENCGAQLFLRGTAIPAFTPSIASVPGVQVEAGEVGEELDRDLLYLGVHGASVGPTQNLLVRKFKTVGSLADLGGAKYEQVGSDLEFLPLRLDADSPVPGGSYNDPQMLIVAMDVAADRALQVALYEVSVKDGDHYSPSFPFPGPCFRDAMFYPVGGAGGADECFAY